MKMTEIAERMKEKFIFLVGGKCWKIGKIISDREHAQNEVNNQNHVLFASNVCLYIF